MKSIITLENVSYQYDSSQSMALEDINLSIKANEWIAVVGRNGSGKSTFGRLLNGLLIPNQGIITVNGLSTYDETTIWAVRKYIGMVFQNPDHQFVATTVRDDLAFGLENLGLEREEMIKRIETYSSMIGISSILDREPHRLSGGQKQRVAIAGIMMMEPSVIVFDEATSMLDPIGRKEVLETMKMLHQRGFTIISITHDMDEAVFADRIILLEAGYVAYDEAPSIFFQDQEMIKNKGLELPFSLLLQKQLMDRGIEVSKLCMSEEELISELWRLYLVK